MRDEMNMLREVSSTAAAHGSNALSEMLNKKIILRLPVVDTIKQDSSMEVSNEVVISLQTRILTGLEGKLLLIFEEKSAFRLVTLCYQNNKASSGVLTEVGLSVLKEIGNVVVSSYAGALSVFLKKVVVPSTPTLISGPLSEIIDSALSGKGQDYTVIIDTFFSVVEEEIKGRMELILTQRAMQNIRDACKDMLGSV